MVLDALHGSLCIKGIGWGEIKRAWLRVNEQCRAKNTKPSSPRSKREPQPATQLKKSAWAVLGRRAKTRARATSVKTQFGFVGFCPWICMISLGAPRVRSNSCVSTEVQNSPKLSGRCLFVYIWTSNKLSIMCDLPPFAGGFSITEKRTQITKMVKKPHVSCCFVVRKSPAARKLCHRTIIQFRSQDR